MRERHVITSETSADFFRDFFGLTSDEIDAVREYLKECEEVER